MERNESSIDNQSLEAWYDSLQNDHPFNLEVKSVHPGQSGPFRALSIFPWDITSLSTLWNGEFASEATKAAQWRTIYEKWSGIVAVGGGSKLRLFLSRPQQQYLPITTLEVPEMRIRFGDDEKTEKADITCITWCMVQNADGFWPLVAFAANSILYLYNVEKVSYHGVLKGHGGKISSLAVHPVDPSILASASYDHTCRIYDLTKRIKCKIDNPHWPGQSKMALGDAPFGLRSNEPEGEGYGRCTTVLVGGHSGGHLAPVLGVAFHPSYPLIATCGMDHAVKLWSLPVSTGDRLRISREDKPLFSSTAVHDAQVLSITWMSKDMLLSNCGKVIMRDEKDGPLYFEPGTLVLWQWHGLDRFFPPDRKIWPAMLRGCASDYQGSSSYKLISKYNLPHPQFPTRTFVFKSSAHAPLIAIPSLGCVHLSSVRHFKPRLPPYFVPKADELATATDKLRLNATSEGNANRNRELPCWIVDTMEGNESEKNANDADKNGVVNLSKLEACAIAEDGRLLIGVGENEGIWIWRIPFGKQVK